MRTATAAAAGAGMGLVTLNEVRVIAASLVVGVTTSPSSESDPCCGDTGGVFSGS